MEHDAQGAHSRADFAEALRAAISRRGLPLRAIRRRLQERGYDISVASLSLWQNGARTPRTDVAWEIVPELEDILGVASGELVGTLRPRVRVAEDRNATFAELSGEDLGGLADEEAVRDLSERSGSIVVSLDALGRIRGTVNRTLWQARVDEAQRVTVFFGIDPSESRPPRVRGTIGCELTDVVADMDARLMRATLRLDSPIPKGALALTERESFDRQYDGDDRASGFTVVAPRRQAEVGLAVIFDPACVPRRCTAFISSAASSRSHPLVLNGSTASHVEFDFGPGSISIDWEW